LTRQLHRHLLVEELTLRGQEDYRPPLRCLALNVLHSGKQRLRLHQHALPAAEGIVVHRAMPIAGVVTDVVEEDLDDPLFHRPLDDALLEGAAEHARKDGEDIDAHNAGYPCNRSTLPPLARWSPPSPRTISTAWGSTGRR